MAEPILLRATASVVIRAEPGELFDAWLDPQRAARFLAAGDMAVSEIALDPREGGEFRIVMRGEREAIEHRGRYVLIERPRRLVFTWVSPGTDWRLSLVSVVFTPVAGGVRIDLEHEGLPDADRTRRHQRGWGTILEKLGKLAEALSSGHGTAVTGKE
ncbi:MAG: SRPBCC domain-containing protein [Hyphomicrobiales bacterium]